jgi:hypothetical protein
MRNDIHESGHSFLSGAPSAGDRARHRPAAGKSAVRSDALNAPAVDAVLEDETVTRVMAQRGSRRELTAAVDAERRSVDVPHLPGPLPEASDGALLQRLALQLSALQSQQDQIRRLLEQAEARRTGSSAAHSQR